MTITCQARLFCYKSHRFFMWLVNQANEDRSHELAHCLKATSQSGSFRRTEMFTQTNQAQSMGAQSGRKLSCVVGYQLTPSGFSCSWLRPTSLNWRSTFYASTKRRLPEVIAREFLADIFMVCTLSRLCVHLRSFTFTRTYRNKRMSYIYAICI